MIRTLALCTLLFLTGCVSDLPCKDIGDIEPGFYGGDGNTMESAIEGIGYSPYDWFTLNLPDVQLEMQELIIPPDSKLKFDLFTYKTASGETGKKWFKINPNWYCW